MDRRLEENPGENQSDFIVEAILAKLAAENIPVNVDAVLRDQRLRLARKNIRL